MKKKEIHSNAEEIKKAQTNKTIKRDLQYFSELLKNIKYETVSFKDIEQKMKFHSFKGAIVINSKNEIYRHVSIAALSKYYNIKTTYKVYPVDSIVDMWFSNVAGNPYKQVIWNVDVLILHDTNALDRNNGPIRRVLVEIIETRKGFNKDTWIFTQSNDINDILANNSIYALNNYINKSYNY